MSDYKKITRDTYNTIAHDYIARDIVTIAELSETVNKAILHFGSLLPAQATILDVGIGGGRDARLLADQGFIVQGIDFSTEIIKVAQEKYPHPGVSYQLMDAEAITFPPHSFDGVLANASLHHIPKKNLPAVLKKIREILKPGGYFQAMYYAGESEGFQLQERYGTTIERYFACYLPEEIEDVYKKAGFTPISCDVRVGYKWLYALAKI